MNISKAEKKRLIAFAKWFIDNFNTEDMESDQETVTKVLERYEQHLAGK